MGPKKQRSKAKKGPEVSDEDTLAIGKRATRTQNARPASRSTKTREPSEDLEEDDGFVFTRKSKAEAAARPATRGKAKSIESEPPATRGDKRKKAKDDDDEREENVVPQKDAKRAKKTAASTRAKRANSDHEAEVEDELIPEPKSRRVGASNGSSKKAKALLDEEEEEEEEAQEPAPKRGRPKKTTKDQPPVAAKKGRPTKKKQEEDAVERPQRKTRSVAGQEEEPEVEDELAEPPKGQKGSRKAATENDKPKRGGRRTKTQQQNEEQVEEEEAAVEEEPQPKRGTRRTRAQQQKDKETEEEEEEEEDALVAEEPKPKRGGRKAKTQRQNEEPPTESKSGKGRRSKKQEAPPSPPPEEEPRKTRQATSNKVANNSRKKGTSTLASFETSSADEKKRATTTKKTKTSKADTKGKSKLASLESDESERDNGEEQEKVLEDTTTGSDDKAFQLDDVNEPNDHKDNNNDDNDANNNDGNNDTTPRATTTSQEEVVSLPISDTPVIRRNQELRRKSGVRRSSLGNRGKRVSSIGNGFVAVPHDDVDPKDFYKHADSDIPDPHRMKQILLWCSKRVLDSQNEQLKKLKERPKKSTADETTALTIARVIEDEIIRDLVQGKVSTSWWTRPEESENDREVIKQPNSQNVTNAENLKAFEKRLKDLDNEKAQWTSLLESIKSREPIPPETIATTSSSTTDTREQVDKAVSQFQRIQEKCQTLEPTVDKLYDSVHKIQSISQASRIFHSNQMKELTSLLNQNTSSQSSKPPIRDILRSLTRLQPPPQPPQS